MVNHMGTWKYKLRMVSLRITKRGTSKSKPTDFERSEEITLTGHATDSAFIATDILMKCPSKYTDKEGVMPESASVNTPAEA